LAQQKATLEGVLETQRKEQTDMYEHSLREVNARDVEIAQHKETIKGLTKAGEQIEEQLNEEIARVTAERDELEARLQETIEQLEAQLKELNDFKESKLLIEKEIAELRAKLESMKVTHKVELEEKVKDYTLEQDRLRTDMLRRLKKTRDELFRLTDEQLHSKMHQTIKENDKLTRELEMYARESKQLLESNQKLATENANLKIELALQNSSTEELIRKSQAQQSQIKSLNGKLKGLEQTQLVTKEVTDDDEDKKVTELMGTVDQQYGLIMDLKREVDELKDANGAMERQLRHSKQTALAQTAMQKEAKTFLLQCLEDVKSAIKLVNEAGGYTKAPYDKRGSQLLTLSASEREGVLQFLVQKLRLFDADGEPNSAALSSSLGTRKAAESETSSVASVTSYTSHVSQPSGPHLPHVPLSGRSSHAASPRLPSR